MNKKLITLTFLMIIGGLNSILSQQSVASTQYFFFDYLFNPSLSGMKQYNNLNLNYSRQWLGFESSPSQICVGYDFTNNKNKNGFGVSFQNEDQAGSYKQNSLGFNYSKHITLSENTKLSAGFGVIFKQMIGDYTNLILPDQSDPTFNMGRESNGIIDGTFGINYTKNNFRVGISSLNINESKLVTGNNSSNISQFNPFKRQFYLNSSYSIAVKNKVDFYSNALFKLLNKDFFFSSIVILAKIKETFLLGVGNRIYSTTASNQNSVIYNNSTFSFFMGIEKKSLSVTFNYDISNNILFPSSELTLGYKFIETPSRKGSSSLKNIKTRLRIFGKKGHWWDPFFNNKLNKKIK
jgi:type IX secretion system PorP/SprF family membrane protein|tara:strand:+ start:386 stop:1438 length:1053 start_codon:yes stop_codon:yes gene_type:complete